MSKPKPEVDNRDVFEKAFDVVVIPASVVVGALLGTKAARRFMGQKLKQKAMGAKKHADAAAKIREGEGRVPAARYNPRFRNIRVTTPETDAKLRKLDKAATPYHQYRAGLAIGGTVGGLGGGSAAVALTSKRRKK